jgi:hypothetical protein
MTPQCKFPIWELGLHNNHKCLEFNLSSWNFSLFIVLWFIDESQMFGINLSSWYFSLFIVLWIIDDTQKELYENDISFMKQSCSQFIKSFENSRQMWPNMLFVFRNWHGIVIMFNKRFDAMLEIYGCKLGKNVITFSIWFKFP